MAGTSLEHRSGASDDGHGAEVAKVTTRRAGPVQPRRPERGVGLARPLARNRAAWLAVPAVAGRRRDGAAGLFGNHESRVEDCWLIAIAVLMAIWLVAGEIKMRKDRARRPVAGQPAQPSPTTPSTAARDRYFSAAASCPQAAAIS